MVSEERVAAPRGRARTAAVLVVAALVGAALVVGGVSLFGRGDPAASPSSAPSSSPASTGPTAAVGARPCTGGSDPAQAAVESLKGAATPEGAAEAAAGVVRFVLSTQFGDPDLGPRTVRAIAQQGGSPELEDLQRGQAPFRQRLTTSAFHPGQGEYAVTADPVRPTVTVVAPWEQRSSEGGETVWAFYDVDLVREDDHWAVVTARVPAAPDGLAQLGGADTSAVTLARYAAALQTAGFRRYVDGAC
jgi:hypothetical protein